MLHGTDLVHEVVAGGSIDLPIRRQSFIATDDLLNHKISRTRWHRWRPLHLQLIQAMAKAPAILRRIGQAINMVNTKSINQAFGIEPEQNGVRRLKDRWI